jgi:NAD(P)-dependent dehydrogenase (short-subunit alcohol dehydrogenase family)
VKRRTRDLAGSRVLITGAASGIGRATAVLAARAGARLLLTDVSEEALATVAGELSALEHRALDVSDYEAVRAWANDVHSTHGSVDVVMNIAGISTWGPVQRLEHRHWRRMIEVDLLGPIHVIECFLPAMIDAGRGGQLVNVSSAAGLFGLPWHAAYSAAKFGLRGVSEVLRFDLRRHGIGVTLVCPGAVATPLVQTVEIVGLERDDPRLQKFKRRFARGAVSPERAAAAIVDGVVRNRYLVFTSNDIRALYWTQRLCAPVYELVMRGMNRLLVRALDR